MSPRTLCLALIAALGASAPFVDADATDRPMVEAVLDHDSGAVLWSNANLILRRPSNRGRPARSGSRIDLRSSSRCGRSDFGVNAARIHDYRTALRAATTSQG
jgi:hypothetical protein